MRVRTGVRNARYVLMPPDHCASWLPESSTPSAASRARARASFQASETPLRTPARNGNIAIVFAQIAKI